MGFKFRKSIKMGPVRVNLSKSGVGYSVGGKGLRVTKKAGGGTRTTVSIPGTGISYSKNSSHKKIIYKKKSSFQNKSNYNSSSADQTTSADISGCLTFCLWIVGICFAIGLICKYWKIILALALIALSAYIAFKVYRKRNVDMVPELSTQIETATETIETPEKIPIEEPVEVSVKEADPTIVQFEEDLQSIPRTEILLSDPVERHLLRDLPEYSFSNITRKTHLDSIFPLVFLDVETTGFAPSKCEIVEVAAIKFDSGMTPVAAFTTLCKPKKAIPEEASSVNHITDEMVADAPTFAQIAPALTEFLKGCHVAGHNLDFDLRFIFAHGAELHDGVRFYDTLDLARLTIPSSSVYDYKLDTVCGYYGIRRNGSHRALSDCYATSKLFSHLVFDKTSRQLDVNADILSEKDAE